MKTAWSIASVVLSQCSRVTDIQHTTDNIAPNFVMQLQRRSYFLVPWGFVLYIDTPVGTVSLMCSDNYHFRARTELHRNNIRYTVVQNDRTPVKSSNSCTEYDPISVIFGLKNRQRVISLQVSNCEFWWNWVPALYFWNIRRTMHDRSEVW